MSQEFDILNGTDEFPYPTSIIQTDFKNFDSDSHEIDLFLYKNYRFSSIDSIIKELTELSTNLNQNLLDLVNDDYHDFIDLGKSINDGLDLINAIVEDLKNFEIELVNYYKKFSDLDNRLYQILQNRKFLNNLKTCIKLNLILHDQITEFDNCMNNQIQEENNIQGLNQLKTLTSLYLSINNIEIFLNKFIQLGNIDDVNNSIDNNDNDNNNGNHRVNSPFHDNYINNKIASIKLEFKSYLDQLIRKELQKKTRNSQIMIELLNIYKLIGEEKSVMSIISSK
ncbi:hypothetical protein MEM_05623 [Candida albicans L26]|uniref:Conserved oligomeric Golgi complex subunit 2 n=2 Tax=Candida albicans TaxID=5476 RepID=A0A1D8PS93_CANAL|nr:Golgi transport complex subunit [Candida albicans SC5314]KGR04504.1 hypothetical protein MG3_05633 [Candida albicans P78048]KGU03337.1 hypothetical protein MEM_05623 [Candida albicans L26]KGU03602.1 hypothetical protein MEY_05573 [Candida albicans 19F]KHC45024.1 hypothetical protein MEW_05567 [Candida albicans P60002]KHC46345.1 hypothetical protein MGC_05597 [Candida albicans P37039]KHC61292.1 hypothetical protein MGI_05580 [Candida albicans P75016]|eukprot:XP_715753.2 Golgi transport complex subunit [Candida albicans SC5314]